MSQPRLTELMELREKRDNPPGSIQIRCLAAEVANDAIVPVVGVVEGSEIHVVDVAAGFGVFYGTHWYNIASGAVIK